MNIIAKIAIGGGALLVAGGIIWAACKKPWNKGEKKNNDNTDPAPAPAPETKEGDPAPAPAPEAPAPEAGNKTDEK